MKHESSKSDKIFATRQKALLLVLDRKDDPVTPLLTQWHYQAMVHQFLGIQLNRVDLAKVPNLKLDEKEVVLAQAEDDFFRQHMFDNYGDLGGAVQKQMMDFKAKHQKTKDLQSGSSSIEDIQKIVDDFPELRKNSNEVAKHVTLMSEIARRVGDHLLAISALEQDICCGDGHSSHVSVPRGSECLEL